MYVYTYTYRPANWTYSIANKFVYKSKPQSGSQNIFQNQHDRTFLKMTEQKKRKSEMLIFPQQISTNHSQAINSYNSFACIKFYRILRKCTDRLSKFQKRKK